MKIKLSLAEWRQLEFYVENTEEEGVYYGVKKYFDKRAKRIKEYIEEHLQEIYDKIGGKNG